MNLDPPNARSPREYEHDIAVEEAAWRVLLGGSIDVADLPHAETTAEAIRVGAS